MVPLHRSVQETHRTEQGDRRPEYIASKLGVASSDGDHAVRVLVLKNDAEGKRHSSDVGGHRVSGPRAT